MFSNHFSYVCEHNGQHAVILGCSSAEDGTPEGGEQSLEVNKAVIK